MEVLAEHRRRCDTLSEALERLLSLHKALHDVRNAIVRPPPGEEAPDPGRIAELQAQAVRLVGEIGELRAATFPGATYRSDMLLRANVDSTVGLAEPPPPSGPEAGATESHPELSEAAAQA